MTSGFPSVDGATVWVNFSSRGGPADSLAGPGSRRNSSWVWALAR